MKLRILRILREKPLLPWLLFAALLAIAATYPLRDVIFSGSANEIKSGAALTNNGTFTNGAAGTVNLSAGTFTPPATMPASSGANLTALNGSNVSSGTVADARIDSALARDAEVAAAYQPIDADLATYAAITPSANVQSVLGAANYPAMRTMLGVGTGDSPVFADVEIGTVARLIRLVDNVDRFIDEGSSIQLLSLAAIGVGYATTNTLWGATAGHNHVTTTIGAGAGRWDGMTTVALPSPSYPMSTAQVDWDNPMGVELAVTLTLAATPTTGDGVSVLFPGARVSNGNTLTGKGWGFSLKWNGTYVQAHLILHNGTTLTTTALTANLARAAGTAAGQHKIRVLHAAGSAQMWVDGLFIGKATGGPVSTGVYDSPANTNFYFLGLSEGGAVTAKYLPPKILIPSSARIRDAETLVFVWLGQSNAMGGDYTATGVYPIDGLIFDSGKGGTWGVDAACPSSGTGEVMRPIMNGFGLAAGANLGQAHIYFARRIARLFPGKRIVIVKHACNGSGLADSWTKTANIFYPSITATVASVLSGLRATTSNVRLAGAYWWQGENDCDDRNSGYVADSAAYETNLRQLRSDLRADLDSGAAPYLPFLFVRLPSWQVDSVNIIDSQFNQVRAALETVGNEEVHSDWVNGDDLPDSGDHIHTTTAGLQTMGARAADAMFATMGYR